MSTYSNGLMIAQAFIHCVDTRDRVGLENLLDPGVRQVFVMNSDPAHPSGVFERKDQVLAYTFGLFAKFDSLVWVARIGRSRRTARGSSFRAKATAWRAIPRLRSDPPGAVHRPTDGATIDVRRLGPSRPARKGITG